MFRSEPLPIGYSIPKGYKRKRPAGSPTHTRLKRQNQKKLSHVLAITHKEIAKGRQQHGAQITRRHVQTLINARSQAWFATWRRYTGYLQKIMDDITKDLPGVAVYLDDIVVSNKNAEDHLHNFKQLLQQLSENGLRVAKRNVSLPNPCGRLGSRSFSTRNF